MLLDGLSDAAIHAAAVALAAGELLAFPTETVYGLGADAGNDRAVEKIFTAKGRPSDHPLIVHVDDAQRGRAAVAHFARAVPDFAQRLMQAFWPGPLTLILPRRAGVGSLAAGGQDSIGLRCPDHPVAQQLLRACRTLGVMGLAGPSANQFGRVSPTTAAHVRSEFGDRLLILDGGACRVGIESTIVDCSRGVPVLLRPGAIGPAQLAVACGQPVLTREQGQALQQGAPRAAGTLAAHYAPRARLRLMDAKALQMALDGLQAQGPAGGVLQRIAVYARSAMRTVPAQVLVLEMPQDAVATAQQLFATLRRCDDSGCAQVWVETPPATPDWDAVRDRLHRAAV